MIVRVGLMIMDAPTSFLLGAFCWCSLVLALTLDLTMVLTPPLSTKMIFHGIGFAIDSLNPFLFLFLSDPIMS